MRASWRSEREIGEKRKSLGLRRHDADGRRLTCDELEAAERSQMNHADLRSVTQNLLATSECQSTLSEIVLSESRTGYNRPETWRFS